MIGVVPAVDGVNQLGLSLPGFAVHNDLNEVNFTVILSATREATLLLCVTTSSPEGHAAESHPANICVPATAAAALVLTPKARNRPAM